MKYIMFVTPKAFATLDFKNIPEKFKDIEVIATCDIYMNMLDPTWTEEMCDNRAYIIDRESFDMKWSIKKMILEFKC